jgi:RNA polymerase sigma factor (TIGR02999 family)
MSDVTRILDAISAGDAGGQLFPLVYNELRRPAAYRLAREAPGQTLEPTALVHEAYIRLVGDGQFQWQNRGHFFAAAAESMRRILIDRARGKKRLKRGARAKRLDLKAPPTVTGASLAPGCTMRSLDKTSTRERSVTVAWR